MSNNYNRNQLAIDLGKKLNIPTHRAAIAVGHMLELLEDTLAKGQKVEFRGFGIFEPIQRKAKVGRNPRNPDAGGYLIPPRRVIRFKSGKNLFSKLNPDQAP